MGRRMDALSAADWSAVIKTDAVIVMACDSWTFPDKHDARCLLYIALSRAKKRLMLVVSRNSPSPLVTT
jgi:hypothetical protein